MSTTLSTPTSSVVDRLRERCIGVVVDPSDSGYDAARTPWALTADQRPAAIAFPADAGDVACVVKVLRDEGLRLAVQGTGHAAHQLDVGSDTVLVRTSALTGVKVDPVARIARAGAGALWQDVVPAAAAHGLAPLAGSSPDVGVVGYSLGGGIGYLSRRHGLACNHVTAIELVTPDGDFVRCDHEHEAELFWALRGGSGRFGIVTAIEFALEPVAELYAGAMFWPWERAAEVLEAWRALTANAPDELTSMARLLQLPPLPEVPEPLRGRAWVNVQLAYLGDEAAGPRWSRACGRSSPSWTSSGPCRSRGSCACTAIRRGPRRPSPTTRCSTSCPPRRWRRCSRSPGRARRRPWSTSSCATSAARSPRRLPARVRWPR
jgi:FAD/FMN-containing dehydrogenase